MLAACSSSAATGASSSATTLTPQATALAWFHAINTNNVAAARRLFTPTGINMITWMNGPPSDQSTFSSVSCQTVSKTDSNSTVHCTFKESASPSEGNPDSFWNLSMVKSSDNRWLIDNYGQG
jgi:hypothetical protein